MAVLYIPISPGEAKTSVRVELEGETYVMEFTYRERTPGWYVDLYDDEDNAILHGRRLSVGGYPFDIQLELPGLMLTVGNDDYDVNSLGKDLGLVYITSDEDPRT